MKIAEIKGNTIYTWFYILLLAGYIAISCFPYFLSVESRTITIPFRAIVLMSSLGIIVYSYYFKINFKFHIADYFFIFFWIVYLVAIYFSFKNYLFAPEIVNKKSEIYLRVVGVSFLPSLAILTCNPKHLNYQFILKNVYIVFFLILLLNVFWGIEYDYQGRSSGISSTYSISFGHYGTTLALLSMYYLVFKNKNSFFETLVYLGGIVLGLYIIYASATRSPLVSLLIALGYIVYLKTNFKYLVALILCLLSLVVLVYFLNIEVGTIRGNAFFSRLNAMIVSGNSSGRGEIYKQAITVFKNNPFFGGSFLFKDGLYAHNFILDILMSMGFFGLLIFIVFFKNSMLFVLNVKKQLNLNLDSLWINIIFVQFVIFASFSSSLFDMPEFWYLMAMTMILFKNNVSKKDV